MTDPTLPILGGVVLLAVIGLCVGVYWGLTHDPKQ